MSPRVGALTKGFIVELDGLRGIAILMVMVHRFWPRTGVGVAADVAGAGWIGVDLFFVISGFLIAGILLDTKGDAGYFRNFYARRALRIFPLYYVFVIGVFVAFSGNPGFRDGAGSPIWYLLHLGNVPEGLLDKPVPYWLAPVWSLAIEEQFYLTFPWLVVFLDRRRLTYVLVAMIATAPAIRLVTMLALPDYERVQYLFTLCRIDTIAAGCLLAVIVRSVDVAAWRDRAKIAAVIVLPAVIILAVGSRLDRTSPFDRVFGYSLVAVGCACVVALVLVSRGGTTTALLRYKPLTYLGKLCFGLYLLHRPADTIVMAVAGRLGIDRELWLMVPKIIVAVALATISWRLLERPFLHLKDRFATARHPNAALAERAPLRLPGFVTRALRMIGILVVLGVLACDGGPENPTMAIDGGPDATRVELPVPMDVETDASVEPMSSAVLYPEGLRHSPITAAVAARLLSIAAVSSHDDRVFAKVGDSITVDPAFMSCFDGGFVDLGGRTDLAPTLSYFLAGNAAGTSPFARISAAAKGGTTARDAMNGMPCPLDQELSAIAPRIEIVLFGTNEARYDWTLDAFGSHLWRLVDASIARGVIPVMSTIPANPGYPNADARIPTFNRVVRAIAQGRGVPLVDLHHELASLPNRGISADQLHPSVAPGGGCVLTSSGLQYGYNVRNLISIEALTRTLDALAGSPPDSSAPTRMGSGREADPFTGSLPLVDLGDTRNGEDYIDHGCGASSGHQVAYRVHVPTAMAIEALVVERPGTDAEIRIVAGGTCVGIGEARATATVPAGPIDVLVDARSAAADGEYVVVIQPR